MNKAEAKSDEEIAEAAQAGDAGAFGILIDRYGKKISRYGRKFISNNDDIEDLVQEVFIKTYVNIQSFDIKRRFSPWLYRIAHNEFVNALKKKKRALLPLFESEANQPRLVAKEKADKQTNENEIKKILNRCLSKLGPKYREPLILYYFEEMDYREIADILRLPISTIGVRLSRARGKLKEFYEKYE